MSKSESWHGGVCRYFRSLRVEETGAYRSSHASPGTLYGTCYALQTFHYLSQPVAGLSESLDFIARHQDGETGLFVGPELIDFFPPSEATHNREHLLWHLTATCLPVLQLYKRTPATPLRFMAAYRDIPGLDDWLSRRDLKLAWLEGNNLLFMGQFLLWMKEHEDDAQAGVALDRYMAWLDREMDPATGLWGSNGHCPLNHAIYGGYHQLILYYYLRHEIPYAENLAKSVLSIEHRRGGFSYSPGGGACEDVDCVDILVNIAKRHGIRRAAIKASLEDTAALILRQQNPDGGFPYSPDRDFSHMGIPMTRVDKGSSNAFATWFRVHTLGLIGQIAPEAVPDIGDGIGFNTTPSMGWHDLTLPYAQALSSGETRDYRREKIRRRLRRLLGRFLK